MTTPRVFLLPKATPSSPNFVVISLPHPRTSAPTRFLLHPDTGLHEITKITPTATAPRSWLLAGTPSDTKDEKTPPDWVGDGQIIQDASLYVSTPVDPLFVLLPRLLPAGAPKVHFLPLDDVLDTFTATDDDDDDVRDSADKSHWGAALKPGSVARRQVEARIRVVCDTVDVDGETAYRPSMEKVLALLVGKCEAMAEGGLPKSMEDMFVVKPLVRPISEEQPEGGEEEAGKEGHDAAMEETSKTTLVVVGKSNEEKKDEETVDEESTPPKPRNLLPPASKATIQLLRLRVASQFLSASYLPTHLSVLLATALTSAHDFTSLDTYLSELKRLRSEALSLRSGDFSMKRSLDDDGGDAGAGKRRKKEEEEAEKKRKKNVSKGVRDLGKANTRGMAKMTSFFKKKV